jgi:hypothetical protein
MRTARSAVSALLDIFHVVGVDGDDLKGALDLPILNDGEDTSSVNGSSANFANFSSPTGIKN